MRGKARMPLHVLGAFSFFLWPGGFSSRRRELEYGVMVYMENRGESKVWFHENSNREMLKGLRAVYT